MTREQQFNELFYATLVLIQCVAMIGFTMLAILLNDPVVAAANLLFAYSAMQMTLNLRRT